MFIYIHYLGFQKWPLLDSPAFHKVGKQSGIKQV